MIALVILGDREFGHETIQKSLFNLTDNSNIKLYTYSERMVSLDEEYKQYVLDGTIAVYPNSFSASYLNNQSGVNWDSFYAKECYDAVVISILSLVMKGVGSRLIENLGIITNEPGETIFPTQLKHGIEKILNNESINYRGASFDKLSRTTTISYENKDKLKYLIYNKSERKWLDYNSDSGNV